MGTTMVGMSQAGSWIYVYDEGGGLTIDHIPLNLAGSLEERIYRCIVRRFLFLISSLVNLCGLLLTRLSLSFFTSCGHRASHESMDRNTNQMVPSPCCCRSIPPRCHAIS